MRQKCGDNASVIDCNGNWPCKLPEEQLIPFCNIAPHTHKRAQAVSHEPQEPTSLTAWWCPPLPSWRTPGRFRRLWSFQWWHSRCQRFAFWEAQSGWHWRTLLHPWWNWIGGKNEPDRERERKRETKSRQFALISSVCPSITTTYTIFIVRTYQPTNKYESSDQLVSSIKTRQTDMQHRQREGLNI